jgi:cellulose synthase operon protein B
MINRMRTKALGCLLSGLMLIVPSFSDGAPDAMPVAPPISPAIASAQVSTRVMTFKQMGSAYPLQLRGGQSMAGVYFGSRADEMITGLRLRLRYTYSPAMLADLSHIQVLLNDEVVNVLPLPKDQGGKPQQIDLPLDARLLANLNQLKFRLIGHYTLRCEDETHSSLWAEISNTSELAMTVQTLSTQNDLTNFPQPFFDKNDFTPLRLPMVFAASPGQATLRAAGELASWFGSQASWRGARFSAALNALPPGQNAIVFATNAVRPGFLSGLAPVTGPTVRLIDHPSAPGRKLLLILGRNEQDLQLATDALVLGQAGMSGSLVQVRGVRLDAPRKPYDAPNWVRPDRPTRLGELVANPQDLQASGQQLASIRINFRVPGDLFTWGSRGVPMDLKFRYTGPQSATGSRLNVGINDLFVQSLNLNASGVGSAQTSLRLPVLDNGLLSSVDRILLPPFRVGSRNALQFQYVFTQEKQGECANGQTEGYRAAIDPDSTIDFSAYPHYAALPNLALFATSGYPFTRMADLSETAVILPDAPRASDIAAFLSVMGKMGDSTGYPALRYRLVAQSAISSAAGRDLLIIGDSASLPLLRRWRDKLPTTIGDSERRVADGDGLRRVPGLDAPGTDPVEQAGQADFTASGRVGALLGMESPLDHGRSVVVVTGSEPAAMDSVADALLDDAKVAQMSGSVVLIRGSGIDSQQIGPVYYVGSLPLWTWVWLYLSEHPLVLAILSALTVLLATFAILRLFKALAKRRLRES